MPTKHRPFLPLPVGDIIQYTAADRWYPLQDVEMLEKKDGVLKPTGLTKTEFINSCTTDGIYFQGILWLTYKEKSKSLQKLLTPRALERVRRLAAQDDDEIGFTILCRKTQTATFLTDDRYKEDLILISHEKQTNTHRHWRVEGMKVDTYCMSRRFFQRYRLVAALDECRKKPNCPRQVDCTPAWFVDQLRQQHAQRWKGRRLIARDIADEVPGFRRDRPVSRTEVSNLLAKEAPWLLLEQLVKRRDLRVLNLVALKEFIFTKSYHGRGNTVLVDNAYLENMIARFKLNVKLDDTGMKKETARNLAERVRMEAEHDSDEDDDHLDEPSEMAPRPRTYREEHPGLLNNLESVLWDAQRGPVIRTWQCNTNWERGRQGVVVPCMFTIDMIALARELNIDSFALDVSTSHVPRAGAPAVVQSATDRTADQMGSARYLHLTRLAAPSGSHVNFSGAQRMPAVAPTDASINLVAINTDPNWHIPFYPLKAEWLKRVARHLEECHWGPDEEDNVRRAQNRLVGPDIVRNDDEDGAAADDVQVNDGPQSRLQSHWRARTMVNAAGIRRRVSMIQHRNDFNAMVEEVGALNMRAARDGRA
ncbi:hypothetical protein CYLTODRAFT_486063 [Cylindrobasidium torrendii FP15055 ss-10]|uniref:Uncharacterized protein n=1 Tax=Cylindrobasidium torrendii FP15055 ss-10 TaxID=1314674 RepID=A0A0D7BQL8_9AGAR|nr:hypothetical protein CYLTODRAFT_486063 [Cylindrobasidium torrendii FP15055 ss-10]